MPKAEVLVDEGFRVSLVETAFFDGKFEIPHISGPQNIVIPKGLVPFSERRRSIDKHSIVSVGTYGQIKTAESKRYFREGLEAMIDELEPEVVLVYGAMPDKIFSNLRGKTIFVQYPDWTTRMKQDAVASRLLCTREN